ncbi:hypothetical protein FRAAL5624 [Frankia alni ACN14a]|uniref:Uncharacterized protein n=1 Tax=Frankia alni (strain DSM 45986 / CECT 9034 / ACN14a) TaxID=326424 RepID=Q0RE55_FRAAA|nr:hypothetical protein FRAAL5624 [Frankia alni ACN14a]
MIILDGAPGLDALPAWLLPAEAGRVLLTSRDPSWEPCDRTLPVGSLSRPEAITLSSDSGQIEARSCRGFGTVFRPKTVPNPRHDSVHGRSQRGTKWVARPVAAEGGEPTPRPRSGRPGSGRPGSGRPRSGRSGPGRSGPGRSGPGRSDRAARIAPPGPCGTRSSGSAEPGPAAR